MTQVTKSPTTGFLGSYCEQESLRGCDDEKYSEHPTSVAHQRPPQPRTICFERLITTSPFYDSQTDVISLRLLQLFLPSHRTRLVNDGGPRASQHVHLTSRSRSPSRFLVYTGVAVAGSWLMVCGSECDGIT